MKTRKCITALSKAERIRNLPICTCHSDLSTLPGVLSSPILLLAVFRAAPQLTERLSSDFKLEVCGWPCCKTWNKEKKGGWLEKWNEIAGSKSKRFLQNVSKASEWLVFQFQVHNPVKYRDSSKAKHSGSTLFVRKFAKLKTRSVDRKLMA